MAKIFGYDQIYNAIPKKIYAFPNYIDKKKLQFNFNLAENKFTDFSITHLCLLANSNKV